MPNSPLPLPQIGITTGDPAGIGPEVSLRAARESVFDGSCRLVLFGDWEILREQAGLLSIPFEYVRLTPDALRGNTAFPDRAVVDIPAQRGDIRPGVGSRQGGEAAARNIFACAGACREGILDAIVTAPLNKRFLKEAGYPYPGHTELLAHLADDVPVAMAFLTERLKVVLATIHVPLRLALEQITPDLIFQKLNIMMHGFPALGLPCRRIAVAGVNPHAGESGLLGSEEIDKVEPALRKARRSWPDISIEGPVPADTVFYRAAQGEFDAVLALFHDQGLGPIKLIGFGEAVNVTIGLPFVRTSVDHGTAFDIAGKGVARHESMISAIRWALRLLPATRLQPTQK